MPKKLIRRPIPDVEAEYREAEEKRCELASKLPEFYKMASEGRSVPRLVKKKVKADLKGYEQVEYEDVDPLNWVLGEVRYDGKFIEKISKEFDNFMMVDKPGTTTTSDGYKWLRAAHFEAAEGVVVVLFPYKGDFEKKEDTQLDRSVTVYTAGKVEDLTAQHVLLKLYALTFRELVNDPKFLSKK